MIELTSSVPSFFFFFYEDDDDLDGSFFHDEDGGTIIAGIVLGVSLLLRCCPWICVEFCME